MEKKHIAILLGVMCLLLTAGIFIQVKTVSSSSTSIGKTKTENELRNSVLKWKEKYDNSYAQLEQKESKLDSLRERAASTDGNSTIISASLEKYNTLLGYTELIGPGVVITLKDADSSNVKGSATNYIVHDGDLIEIVNALKNAGAEAISINGQRITNTTTITCAGNIIKVNGKKIGSPFTINAIGSTSRLYGALTMPGGYLEWLEGDGVQVNVEQVEKSTIIVPKYDGVYKFEYASNVE